MKGAVVPVLAVSALALPVLCVVGFVVFQRWSWRVLVTHRAVVQLLDGTAFDCVVTSRRGPILVLSDVVLRMPTGEQRIDGAVVVERSRVAFVQVR